VYLLWYSHRITQIAVTSSYSAQRGILLELAKRGSAKKYKGAALGHGHTGHSTEEYRHGRSDSYKHLPTVSQQQADLDLDTSGFRDNKETTEIISNVSIRQNTQ